MASTSQAFQRVQAKVFLAIRKKTDSELLFEGNPSSLASGHHAPPGAVTSPREFANL
jgi:hypothetical protein